MSRKKVGILTFHKAYNYGAALQAYALRTVINSYGYECEVIDYNDIGRGARFTRIPISGVKPFIAAILRNVLSIGSEDVRRKKFHDFVNSTIGISQKKFLTKESLMLIKKEYDLFITGSDQVWNPKIANDDFTYLLDFLDEPNRKIAYAPSFGTSVLFERYHRVFAKLINDIQFLSIREQDGKNLIKELTERDADVVLDPTFLLSKENWNSIASFVRIKKPYIFCYTIIADPPGYKQLYNHIKKVTGYNVIKICSPLDKLTRNVTAVCNAGPKDFLGLIKGASMVITNSFHGTVFSIIYEKPFYTLPNTDARNSRLLEILGKLKLTERLFLQNNELPDSDNFRIDYIRVNSLLEGEKGKSISFLKQALHYSEKV